MEFWMPAAFFAIAFLYSNAGFGGGSSYIALLAIANLPYDELRITGLLCNLVVVGIACLLYARYRHFPKRAWLLLVYSIPFAYTGGLMGLVSSQAFVLLGVLLILAGLSMVLQSVVLHKRTDVAQRTSMVPYMASGVIGWVSGAVGIGGGIFLSPLLHLMRWARAVEIAAVASLFIFFNSLAGLAGHYVSGRWVVPDNLWALLIAVAAGGILGNTVSRKVTNPAVIRMVTAGLVVFVGIRLLLR